MDHGTLLKQNHLFTNVSDHFPQSSALYQDFIYFPSLKRCIDVVKNILAEILNKSNYMLMKCSRGILIRTQMLADNISEQLHTSASSLSNTHANQGILTNFI